jgi:hypothetical protein
MNRSEAASAASKAADVVFRAMAVVEPLSWHECCERPLADLAEFVERQQSANAAALYAYAVAPNIHAATWSEVPRSLRTAIEIFRASYLMLLDLVLVEEHLTAAVAEARAGDCEIVLFRPRNRSEAVAAPLPAGDGRRA